MSDKERVEPRNVSLYPSDWRVVDDQDKYGLGTSAALRMIIRQWHENERYRQAAKQVAEGLALAPLPMPMDVCADADVA